MAANHEQEESVWLVSYKKSEGKRYLPYDELVEEALCFGWVDSRSGRADEARTMHLLSPRKAGSAWSKPNRERVKRLIAEGLMTAAGLAKVEAAKKDGSWSFLEDVENHVVPEDLAEAFGRRPGSAENFDSFPPSVKRAILEWIKTARRPATRAKRVDETAAKAAKNERANQWTRGT